MVTVHMQRMELSMTAADIADLLTQNGMPAYVAVTDLSGQPARSAAGHAGLFVVKGTFSQPEAVLFCLLPEVPR